MGRDDDDCDACVGGVDVVFSAADPVCWGVQEGRRSNGESLLSGVHSISLSLSLCQCGGS